MNGWSRGFLGGDSLLWMATVLGLVVPEPASPQVEIDAQVYDARSCFLPRTYELYVPFSGIFASVNQPLNDVLALFPPEWDGKPRVRVGMDVRPPGLRLRFLAPTQLSLLQFPCNCERLVFEPEPPALVDSLDVNWYPVEGTEFAGHTLYDASCFFILNADLQVMVTAEATVNLVAIYATAGDTLEVWGSQVGISDLTIQSADSTFPNPVEDTTWGAIKHLWR